MLCIQICCWVSHVFIPFFFSSSSRRGVRVYSEQAGTIGLEIFEQVKNVDAVVVPVGGAGLIAGVAMAIKTLKPDVTVIGVQPELCPSFNAALAANKPVHAFKSASLADGLAVPMVRKRSFAFC